MANPALARRLFCYAAAAGVSLTALGLIALLQPLLGFLPMLFLPAIVLAEVYWGLRPAALSVALSTAGSLLLMDTDPGISARVNVWSNLVMLPGVAICLVYLMEARRKHRRGERERSAELSILLESMPEAVFIFDTSARVIELNRAAHVLCNCTRDEALGMYLHELATLLGVHQADPAIDVHDLAVMRALRGEIVRSEPRVLQHPGDHALIETVLSANPMREDDEIIGALLVVQDVTEVITLQHRVADTERHMAIGQMAAGIAHDFNNVLETISQAATVLELKQGTPADRSLYVGMIHNAVRRGSEIISRVREYIRGGTGEQSAVTLRESIEEALELTRPMWRAVPDLRVERDLGETLAVRANPADLRRVFANLIINSIQAMPQGGVLTVRCRAVNGTVRASVQDTGPGIPAGVRSKIFLPYFTTKPKGTGLGLSGAQRIVQALGGNISFATENGKGTTFTVELPALRGLKQGGPRAA